MMDSWGYGGYGPIRTIIWIILVIAIVAGIVWRVVRAQQKKVILNRIVQARLRSITAKTFRSSAKFHRLCAAARCLVPLFRGPEVLSSPGLNVRVVKRSSDLTVTLLSHCPLMALIGHSDCAPNCLLLAQCGHSNHVHECPHLGNSGHWLAHSRFLYMNRQKREQVAV
jgi:hypothetical protein